MKMKGLFVVCLIAGFSFLSSLPANAGAIRPGLFTDAVLPANDDGSTGAIPLGFTADFFGVLYSSVYVNNNGNITFDSRQSTYTPYPLMTTNRAIIAPFFADVDTRNSWVVTYAYGIVDGRFAFGVNWVNVGYYASHNAPLNSFQLVLIDRSDRRPGDFDVEFNYDHIGWETGDASGGVGGFGGSSARVGFSNGTGENATSYEMPGSAVNGAFLDGGPNALIYHKANSSVLGRYIFYAKNGNISTAKLIPIYLILLSPDEEEVLRKSSSTSVDNIILEETSSTDETTIIVPLMR